MNNFLVQDKVEFEKRFGNGNYSPTVMKDKLASLVNNIRKAGINNGGLLTAPIELSQIASSTQVSDRVMKFNTALQNMDILSKEMSGSTVSNNNHNLVKTYSNVNLDYIYDYADMIIESEKDAFAKALPNKLDPNVGNSGIGALINGIQAIYNLFGFANLNNTHPDEVYNTVSQLFAMAGANLNDPNVSKDISSIIALFKSPNFNPIDTIMGLARLASVGLINDRLFIDSNSNINSVAVTQILDIVGESLHEYINAPNRQVSPAMNQMADEVETDIIRKLINVNILHPNTDIESMKRNRGSIYSQFAKNAFTPIQNQGAYTPNNFVVGGQPNSTNLNGMTFGQPAQKNTAQNILTYIMNSKKLQNELQANNGGGFNNMNIQNNNNGLYGQQQYGQTYGQVQPNGSMYQVQNQGQLYSGFNTLNNNRYNNQYGTYQGQYSTYGQNGTYMQPNTQSRGYTTAEAVGMYYNNMGQANMQAQYTTNQPYNQPMNQYNGYQPNTQYNYGQPQYGQQYGQMNNNIGSLNTGAAAYNPNMYNNMNNYNTPQIVYPNNYYPQSNVVNGTLMRTPEPANNSMGDTLGLI